MLPVSAITIPFPEPGSTFNGSTFQMQFGLTFGLKNPPLSNPCFASLLGLDLRLVSLCLYAKKKPHFSWPITFYIPFALCYLTYVHVDNNLLPDSYNPVFATVLFVAIEMNIMSEN